MGTTTITVHVPNHGRYYVKPEWIDYTIETKLPTSVAKLRAEVSEQAGVDYSDVSSLFHLLAIHADMNARFMLSGDGY